MLATCIDCGLVFERAPDETCKRRCLSCWMQTKHASERRAATARPAPDPLSAELHDNMRGLLLLCHPDRHAGSTLATRVTQWLLSVRARMTKAAP